MGNFWEFLKSLPGTFSGLPAFFKALPQLLQLIQALRGAIREGQLQLELKDSVKTITEAFNANDAQKLNDLFNSK